MNYSYETRDDDIYLLTDKKTKDKDIIIKMGSSVADIHLVDAVTRATYSLVWKLEQNTNTDKTLINLEGEIDGTEHLVEMDGNKMVKELSDMVINNQTLETCKTLNEGIEKGFNTIFEYMLNTKGVFLCSNIPTNAYVLIKSKGKTIGTASRFSYSSSNMLNVYEYVGKSITRETEVNIQIIIDNHLIEFRTNAQRNSEFDIYDANVHTLGYFNYETKIINITENDSIEVPQIELLNVPKTFTSIDDMNNYVKLNNTIYEIDRYRISLKPKIETIDVNRFMLREFTI